MIKLKKGEEPEVLTRNALHWTNVVVNKIHEGKTPTKTEKGRYNHTDVKQALIEETHGKCAYCESKLRHVSFGDIEHITPKSDDPSKWFSWQNLTLACDVCNTNKSNTPVDKQTFIDPYDVDPEEHFWHLGPMMRPKPGCDAAALTERLLNLNRPELVEKRADRQDVLLRLVDAAERCSNEELKRLLWEEIGLETEAHKEYAALSRTIIELAKTKLGAH